MAFAGTMLGFLAALPLAFLGTTVLFSFPLVGAIRVLVGLIRTIPSILWGVIAVVVVGLGPLAGTLALALYTTGYLAKLYAEAFDAVDPEILEAIRGVGAKPWHIARFAIWTESANYILSQLLFMLEYNVRASAVLGFVGAGGIGFYLQAYLSMLDYSRVSTLLLGLFAFVLVMDGISGWLRRRYLLRY